MTNESTLKWLMLIWVPFALLFFNSGDDFLLSIILICILIYGLIGGGFYAMDIIDKPKDNGLKEVLLILSVAGFAVFIIIGMLLDGSGGEVFEQSFRGRS